MSVRLIHNGAPRDGEEIVIDRFPFMLGRHNDCDYRLYHPMVSRRHCRFTEADGAVVVHDLRSLNGTYLNGRRVEEREVVRDGDEINVGCLSYRVSCPAA
jgi:pSer/pThr/pTyr-binding forkhead associated (FHA) protein